ncbi:MAG: VirB8/TrbF family protein [Methylococcaceae bacterium]
MVSQSIKEKDLEQYFKKGMDWEEDVVKAAVKSEKKAWRIAGISAATAIAAVLSVSVLLPLVRFVPVITEVNKTTGESQIKQKVDKNTIISAQKVMDKYFVHKYIQNREGYDRFDLQSRYDAVILMSTRKVGTGYSKWINTESNPDSYVTTYENRARVIAHVASTSFLERGVSLSRVTLRTIDLSQYRDLEEPREVNIRMKFEYSDMKMSAAERLISPRGFTVTDYRVDPVFSDN